MTGAKTMEAPKPKRRRKPVAEAALTQRVNISAPYAGEANGYQVRRLDATLDARQRRALRLIFDGLQLEGETLSNGRPLTRTQDAVRWLLDKAATELGF
tara:strand:- start:641 stop:937 length:297 start_codon:yes stop_codon:yes gene_type:complete